MVDRTLEERVTALEKQMSGKTLEQHFREQAELFDRRFSHGFREQAELIDRLFAERDAMIDRRLEERDEKWQGALDIKLASLETRLETRLESKLESKLEPVRGDLAAARNDLAVLKDAVKVILTRLT